MSDETDWASYYCAGENDMAEIRKRLLTETIPDADAASRQPCDCHDCDGRWCSSCLVHHGRNPCPFAEGIRVELAELVS